jgi:hypothetical protein
MKANFETGLKVCSRCEVEQAITNFCRSKKTKDKLQSQCKTCGRTQIAEFRRNHPEKSRALDAAWRRKNKDKVRATQARYCKKNPTYYVTWRRRRIYGLSVADMQVLNQSQGGRCPGCLRNLKGVRVNIDHCHTTGKVRGLLCNRCNIHMGGLKDDPEILIRLANYLREAKLKV